MQSEWQLIESDPGVFTELIHKFGIDTVVMEEIIDLDSINKEAYGFVFLFNYKPRSPNTVHVDNLFFAKQIVNNACATLSILHVLMNTMQVKGPLLNLKEFVDGFDSETKGIAVGNSDDIRIAHNSFSVQQSVSYESNKNDKNEDAFHFTSFIPFNGKVYELDGLLNNPVYVGDIDNKHWIDIAVDAIKTRLTTDIRFNLMAIVPDPLIKWKQENNTAMVASEMAKRENWRKENIRRRFNYWPLIFKLLEEQAKSNK